jgi:hypothetical protein
MAATTDPVVDELADAIDFGATPEPDGKRDDTSVIDPITMDDAAMPRLGSESGADPSTIGRDEEQGEEDTEHACVCGELPERERESLRILMQTSPMVLYDMLNTLRPASAAIRTSARKDLSAFPGKTDADKTRLV